MSPYRTRIAVKRDPHLWTKAKEKACTEGGLCKHSARKMQYATRWYKKRGGRYVGPKSANNSLSQWGKQKWRTYSGEKSEGRLRYLPSKAWDALTEEEVKATNSAKLRGYQRGLQWVKQPAAIARKTRSFRNNNVNKKQMQCTALVKDKQTGRMRRCKNGANCHVHKKRKTSKKAPATRVHAVNARSVADLFTKLRSAQVKRFVQGFPFVNGDVSRARGAVTLKLRGHAAKPAWRNIAWSKIRCESVSASIKASPCDVGTRKKVFFKKAKDLKTYIAALGRKTRGISKREHSKLFSTCFQVLGNKFTNHNMDVGTLHFKL